MDLSDAKIILIAAISAVIGYLIYTRTGLYTGAFSIIASGWLLYQFRSLENTWNSLDNFQNPILFGINTMFAAFLYLSWKKYETWATIYLSIAAFLLGGTISTLIVKYWNIGD